MKIDSWNNVFHAVLPEDLPLQHEKGCVLCTQEDNITFAVSKMFQAGEGDRGEEEDSSSKLTDEDKLSCAQVVQDYLAGRIADPVTAGSRHREMM